MPKTPLKPLIVASTDSLGVEPYFIETASLDARLLVAMGNVQGQVSHGCGSIARRASNFAIRMTRYRPIISPARPLSRGGQELWGQAARSPAARASALARTQHTGTGRHLAFRWLQPCGPGPAAAISGRLKPAGPRPPMSRCHLVGITGAPGQEQTVPATAAFGWASAAGRAAGLNLNMGPWAPS